MCDAFDVLAGADEASSNGGEVGEVDAGGDGVDLVARFATSRSLSQS